MHRSAKTVTVMGEPKAGKKTITGCLLYKCSFSLAQLRRWERSGLRRYEDLARFCEEGDDAARCFFAPNGLVVFHSKSWASRTGSIAPVSDYVLWVGDVTSADKGRASCEASKRGIFDGSIPNESSLIILVNKMDKVKWSAAAFEATAKSFSPVIAHHANVRIVPVSASTGDNVLTSPEAHSWLSGGWGSSGSVPLLPLDQPLIRLFE